jgi:hypothetical protein
MERQMQFMLRKTDNVQEKSNPGKKYDVIIIVLEILSLKNNFLTKKWHQT